MAAFTQPTSVVPAEEAVILPLPEGTVDKTSFSNFLEARVIRLSLDLTADFERKVLHGSVTAHVNIVKEGSDVVVLDTRAISVSSVELLTEEINRSLEFTMGEAHAAYGSALRISLPEDCRVAGETHRIRINYETASGDDCSAVQWLPPEQTKGKKHPYLFSQCQAIHCRLFFFYFFSF